MTLSRVHLSAQHSAHQPKIPPPSTERRRPKVAAPVFFFFFFPAPGSVRVLPALTSAAGARPLLGAPARARRLFFFFLGALFLAPAGAFLFASAPRAVSKCKTTCAPRILATAEVVLRLKAYWFTSSTARRTFVTSTYYGAELCRLRSRCLHEQTWLGTATSSQTCRPFATPQRPLHHPVPPTQHPGKQDSGGLGRGRISQRPSHAETARS